MVGVWFKKEAGAEEFVFNLTQNVGLRSPNLPDDVGFVQLGFRATAVAPWAVGMPAEDKQIYAAVPLGPGCNGTENDPLVKAIRRLEMGFSRVRDGHVSRMRDNTGRYPGGGPSPDVYMINVLNFSIMQVHKEHWPMLNRVSGCPPALEVVVTNMFRDNRRNG